MMRALVLSDIHGEESQLRWMLEETWKMTGKIDGYFFLGDGVDDFAQAENFIRRRDPDALMLMCAATTTSAARTPRTTG